LPICASITLIADQALPMLYHNEFLPAVGVMQILAWSFVFTCIAVPNGRLMLVAGRQSASVPIQLGSMIINVALNIFLQPSLGAQGAALARVASTLAVCILSLIYVQRHIYRWNVWPVVAGPLAATVCLVLVSGGLRWLGVQWLLALLIGWVIYGVALVAFRGISPAELRSLIALGWRRNAQTIVKGPS
jgi:O-antigen/teichoic acid export membrane protein